MKNLLLNFRMEMKCSDIITYNLHCADPKMKKPFGLQCNSTSCTGVLQITSRAGALFQHLACEMNSQGSRAVLKFIS